MCTGGTKTTSRHAGMVGQTRNGSLHDLDDLVIGETPDWLVLFKKSRDSTRGASPPTAKLFIDSYLVFCVPFVVFVQIHSIQLLLLHSLAFWRCLTTL